jgi:hypothetical protein
MNDPEALRDYLIADEIQRIQTLSREDLIRELIAVKSKKLEVAPLAELLQVCQIRNGT